MEHELSKFDGKENREAINIILKGLLGMVPYFGTFLNETFFTLRSQIKQNRVNEFVKSLSEKISKIEENKIDHNYLKTDEFSDILELILFQITQTKSDEKMNIYSSIVAESVLIGSLNDYDEDLLYINLISSLSNFELIVLSGIASKNESYGIQIPIFNEENDEDKLAREKYYELHVFDFESKHIDYFKDELFNLPPNIVRIAIEGLISKSLTFDDSIFESSEDEKINPRTSIGLTPLGKGLINYLNKKNC